MLDSFRQLHRGLLASHRLAAPASTLLWASLFAVALGLVTRITFARPAQSAPGISVSSSTSPGGLIEVVVPGQADDHLSAYLPGLTQARVPLVYDPQTGRHRGEVQVPEDAPDRGYCTLRVIDSTPVERDRKVRLRPLGPNAGS